MLFSKKAVIEVKFETQLFSSSSKTGFYYLPFEITISVCQSINIDGRTALSQTWSYQIACKLVWNVYKTELMY